MKKLMIAATAALCATVGFGIESDVVGYAANNTVNGFTLITPQFQNLSDDGFSLVNFSATADMYDNLTVNQIDEYGTIIHTYSWTTSADDGSGNYSTAGWGDDNYMVVTDPSAVKFVPGEALMVSAGEGALQSAGKVRTGDATIQLRNGFTVAGNPYPVNISVADILPSCKDGTIEDTYDQMTLNIIDEYGTVVSTYSWTTSADDGSGESYSLKGWADDDYLLINEDNVKTLAPGQGVLVSGTSDLHYITFPAPEL